MTDPRTRLAIAAGFFTQAMVFITMTTRLPAAQEQWEIGNTALSLLLLMMVLLGGLGSVTAEWVAKRADSATTLRAGLLLITVSVPVIVLSQGLLLGAIGMAAYGVGLGIVDASTNMQAVALEHRYERPILPSFYGAWTLGGIVGAGIASIGLPLWAPALAAVAPLAVAFAPYLSRDHGEAALAEGISVPWRPILLVGLAMALFYMVDVATQTWGATYAYDVFGTTHATAAHGVLAYLLASGAVRLLGDPMVARYGAIRVLRGGVLVGVVALATIVLAPGWPLALAGFALAGAGLACVAPLSFSAAARIAGGEGLDAAARRARVDAVIARFNLFNYAGALLGAVLTGLVGSGNLRLGFAVPMVLVLAIIPLARAFTPPVPQRL